VLLLEQINIEFEIIEYLKTPPNKNDIIDIAKKLGKRPKNFLRVKEKDFKQHDIKLYLEDDNKIAEFIEKFPKIMERPIFINGERAIIGRPPEKVLLLLK